MSYITLKRVSAANPAPAVGFTVSVWQYNTEGRSTYSDTVQAATDPGNFELTVGQLVPGASFCLNTTQRQVRYAGNGIVSTHDEPNAIACASGLTGLTLTSSGSANIYTQDAQLTATWSGAVGPVTVRAGLIMPADPATAAYFDTRSVASGATTAQFPEILGEATVSTPVIEGRDGRGPRLSTYNANTGLAPGIYRVEVTEEATGFTIGAEITITLAIGADPDTVVIYGGQAQVGGAQSILVAGPLTIISQANSNSEITRTRFHSTAFTDILLKFSLRKLYNPNVLSLSAVYYRPSTGALLVTPTGTASAINGATHVVTGGTIFDALPEFTYTLPAGTPLGGTASATVMSNGTGGVAVVPRLVDEAPRIALDNLILFQPSRAGATNGGVIVEAHTSYDHETEGPAFRLYDSANTLLQTNTTGRFDGLGAGAYSVGIQTGGATLAVPFALVAEYGLKWQLNFDDLKNHQPCRLELSPRYYTGPVVTLKEANICGNGEGPGPVTLTSEGVQGGDSQADLPDSIGSSLTMRLRTAPGLLQDVLLGDRTCLVEFYYNNALYFSGFPEIGIYDEALLAGPVDVELTATCGLAALKDIDFAGGLAGGKGGQELRGRRALLPTLLHCLSRTGLSLPVAIYTNRTPAEMTTDEVPELALYTNRLGYAPGGEPLDTRAVVNAICQALGGTLVQRNGEWAIISPLEAAKLTTGRRYTPAGATVTAITLPSPTSRLLPSTYAEAVWAGNAPPSRVWYWIGADQAVQRRAGWRFYTATADAMYATNAFRQGDYFGDAAFWDDSQTVLRPEAGWRLSGAFPLSLVEAGEKDGELAASWPLSTVTSDPTYIESELAPLEAGREGLAFEVSVELKLLGHPDQVGSLWVDIVTDNGLGAAATVGAVLQTKAVTGLSEGFTTAKAVIPFGLIAGALRARVRIHRYTVFPVYRARTGSDLPPNYLLVKPVGIRVLPQGAAWDGKTATVASGAGGSVRPTSPLEVFHVDAPQRAGLFNGVAHAFLRTTTRGPLQPTTVWRRASDLRAASLLDNAVLDVLALRANPSRLLTGTVKHLGYAPECLDTVDIPYDISGRRWIIGSRSWHVRIAQTDITPIEIGDGEDAVYFLPENARILDGRPGGRIRVRGTHRGIRITSGN